MNNAYSKTKYKYLYGFLTFNNFLIVLLTVMIEILIMYNNKEKYETSKILFLYHLKGFEQF